MSQWADRNRKLSRESSAEPGRWKTDRAPYQREIMDAVNDPSIEEITFMKSSQVGATEIINNTIGFFIDQDPSPILLVLPTKEIAEAWSKDRFAPMLRDSHHLRGKVSDVKSRDRNNTLLHKTFPGGHITIGGANSPSGLASRPVRNVLFDEVDRFPSSAGTEGDPIELGKKRSTTFWNHKHIYVSTPTVDGASRIQKSWDKSDQRRFWVQCPACGKKHLLEWKNIQWDKGENGEHLIDTTVHLCPHCGKAETDADLPDMLKNGEWIKGRPEVRGHAGFHINELYSPWVKFSKTVSDFLKMKNDPEQLMVWINTSMGDVWREGKAITSSVEDMLMKRENYGPDPTTGEVIVPFGGVAITVGVDVQDDRLEVETIAWGMNHENWSLEYQVFNGETSGPEVWKALDTHLRKTYRHESGVLLRIMGCGIDTGGHNTTTVYDFCKPRFGRGVFALKGRGGQGVPVVSKPSKNNAGGVNLYHIGTDTAKDSISSFLGQTEHGPGYCHFPFNYGDDYFKMLLAEWPVIRKGVRSWQLRKPGLRNESLDCRVYAFAALKILGFDLNETVVRFMEHVGNNPTIIAAVQEAAQTRVKRVRRVRSAGYGGNYARAS